MRPKMQQLFQDVLEIQFTVIFFFLVCNDKKKHAYSLIERVEITECLYKGDGYYGL